MQQRRRTWGSFNIFLTVILSEVPLTTSRQWSIPICPSHSTSKIAPGQHNKSLARLVASSVLETTNDGTASLPPVVTLVSFDLGLNLQQSSFFSCRGNPRLRAVGASKKKRTRGRSIGAIWCRRWRGEAAEMLCSANSKHSFSDCRCGCPSRKTKKNCSPE